VLEGANYKLPLRYPRPRASSLVWNPPEPTEPDILPDPTDSTPQFSPLSSVQTTQPTPVPSPKVLVVEESPEAPEPLPPVVDVPDEERGIGEAVDELTQTVPEATVPPQTSQMHELPKISIIPVEETVNPTVSEAQEVPVEKTEAPPVVGNEEESEEVEEVEPVPPPVKPVPVVEDTVEIEPLDSFTQTELEKTIEIVRPVVESNSEEDEEHSEKPVQHSQPEVDQEKPVQHSQPAEDPEKPVHHSQPEEEKADSWIDRLETEPAFDGPTDEPIVMIESSHIVEVPEAVTPVSLPPPSQPNCIDLCVKKNYYKMVCLTPKPGSYAVNDTDVTNPQHFEEQDTPNVRSDRGVNLKALFIAIASVVGAGLVLLAISTVAVLALIYYLKNSRRNFFSIYEDRKDATKMKGFDEEDQPYNEPMMDDQDDQMDDLHHDSGSDGVDEDEFDDDDDDDFEDDDEFDDDDDADDYDSDL
jgi:hypothetical protein